MAWISTADGSQKLAAMPALRWQPLKRAPIDAIVIDGHARYQSIAGFGASITDASAWLINHRLSAEARVALMRELFSRRAGAIGLSATRLTIGASDFSQSVYSYGDVPPTPGQPARFDYSPVRREVLPLVRMALRFNPRLAIVASPWSAPAWMKTTDSMIKGRLRPEAYGDFARYLVGYVEYLRAAGVPVAAITVQNEPHFEPANYPGMRMDPADRATFDRDDLGPLMQRRIPQTKLLDWDHNWDQPESPLAVLNDARAARYIHGVAWHCYAGDVAAQSVVRAAHPDKEVWFTECSGGEWAPIWGKTLGWMAHNLLIGATRNWARSVILWNLALDQDHGPHHGGCGDCRGVVTIDNRTGAITRNVEYYALAHLSKFVVPGAVRIASPAAVAGVESVAFENPDRSRVALLYNGSDQPQTSDVVDKGRTVRIALPAGAVATLVWRGG